MKRLSFRRHFIMQYPRHQTGYGIHHNHCCQFSTRQNIIANGHIIRYHFLQYTLINSLVMSTKENQIIAFGKILCHSLGKRIALWCHINHAFFIALRNLLCNTLVGIKNRLRLHQHTCTAAIWIIIHLLMLICRKISDIDRLNGDLSLFNGTTGNGCI